MLCLYRLFSNSMFQAVIFDCAYVRVAAVVRFSGFSLVYGCLALVTPLLRRPTASTMRRMNYECFLLHLSCII